MSAVANVSTTHWNAGRNFGLSPGEIARRVLLPAILPRLLVGLRLALGIAWLVVVARDAADRAVAGRSLGLCRRR